MILDESVIYNYSLEEYERLCIELVLDLKTTFTELKYISGLTQYKLWNDCGRIGAIKLRNSIYEIDENGRYRLDELLVVINETINYIENML